MDRLLGADTECSFSEDRPDRAAMDGFVLDAAGLRFSYSRGSGNPPSGGLNGTSEQLWSAHQQRIVGKGEHIRF